MNILLYILFFLSLVSCAKLGQESNQAPEQKNASFSNGDTELETPPHFELKSIRKN